MWKILIIEFLNDLRVQKTRAFLTMFAITWGTIAIILLLSFGEGLKNTFVSGFTNAGDQVLMLYGGQTGMSHEGMPPGRRIRLMEEDAELLMRTIPEIDMMSVSYGRWGAALQYGRNRTTSYMEGVNPAFEEMRRMYPQQGGRFLNVYDVSDKRRVVFLGHEIAEELFGEVDPIGETLFIDRLPFTVVGIMQDKIQTAMNYGPDSRRVVIPASTLKTIYGPRFVDHMVIRPRSAAYASYVKDQIYRTLGSRYRFNPSDTRALNVWDMVEMQQQISVVMLGIQIFLGVIGGLTLFVAGVGVANIMYVVVRERTREIGIKRAVGARKRHIVSQFIFEALAISFTGGAIGLGFSWAVVKLVQGMPKGDDAMQFLANPELSLPIALTTVGILMTIGLVAGVFPARKAAKVDPVESLRYE